MKYTFFLMIVSLGLAACSHNPPKPYGKFFPINTPVKEQPKSIAKSMTEMNNQQLDESK